jgi:hypothetical protein
MNRFVRHTALFLLLLLQVMVGNAIQSKDSVPTYLQFTGIIVSADSIIPIPFVHIRVKNKPYGDFSDISGKFSFVAEKGDTVVFTHVQYKNTFYIVPDTLNDFKYHIIMALSPDTIYLDGAIVTAVPNRNTFDHFFISSEIPLDKLEIAKKNLEREGFKEQANKMGMDDKENYNAFINYQNKMQYQRGMAPTMTLMNPFAWAKFFEAWKRGDFKKNSSK